LFQLFLKVEKVEKMSEDKSVTWVLNCECNVQKPDESKFKTLVVRFADQELFDELEDTGFDMILIMLSKAISTRYGLTYFIDADIEVQRQGNADDVVNLTIARGETDETMNN
jgi:hypothetical protein